MLCCRKFPATIMDTKKRSIRISLRKRFVSQMPKFCVGDTCVSEKILESKILFDKRAKRGERDGVSLFSTKNVLSQSDVNFPKGIL